MSEENINLECKHTQTTRENGFIIDIIKERKEENRIYLKHNLEIQALINIIIKLIEKTATSDFLQCCSNYFKQPLELILADIFNEKIEIELWTDKLKKFPY